MSHKDPSYSQFREDKILERIFPGKRGTCVEVGANDGITGSTTYYFEKKGWSCVLVEPVPGLCGKIRRFRSSPVFECAASSETGEGVLHVPESAESLSTLSPTALLPGAAGGGTSRVREITIRKRRLDDILLEAGISGMDFVTIDVEGHEMEVMKGFTLEKFRPGIIIVEDNSDRNDKTVEKYLEGKGYKKFFRTGVNDWYAAGSDAVVSPGSVAQLEGYRKSLEFEDKIKTKFSCLDAVVPDLVKPALRLVLHGISKWAQRK